MNKLCVFLLLGILNLNVNAQIGTGQWRLHVPNKTCIDVVANDHGVFAAFENGLLEYDINASETSLWTDVNGLSDINITCLAYDEVNNAIFVGYSNGNIDKIENKFEWFKSMEEVLKFNYEILKRNVTKKYPYAYDKIIEICKNTK